MWQRSQCRDINQKMRVILFDWLIKVGDKFKLKRQTIALALELCNVYIHRTTHSLPRTELQIMGAGCLYLASAYREIYMPEVRDFVYVSDEAFTKETFKKKVLQDILPLVAPCLATYTLYDKSIQEKKEDWSGYLKHVTTTESIIHVDLLNWWETIPRSVCQETKHGKCIGHGAFASVYDMDETTVLKTYNSETDESETFNESEIIHFIRELANLSVLHDGPHMLQLKKVHFSHPVQIQIEHGGIQLLTFMENKEKVPYQSFLLNWVETLQYAEVCGIYHRDLSSKNLLISVGKGRICDWGAARFQPVDKGIFTIQDDVGAPQYCPPEAFLKYPTTNTAYSAKVDIWSLGCNCLRLFLGNKKFEACFGKTMNICEPFIKFIGYPTEENSQELWPLIQKEWPDEWKSTSYVEQRLDPLLKRMLCYSPSERITLTELQQCLQIFQEIKKLKKSS